MQVCLLADPEVVEGLDCESSASEFESRRPTQQRRKQLMPRHPDQPLVFDDKGTVRFKENKIVRFLLDTNSVGLDKIYSKVCAGEFDKNDYQQLMQLIGYSVSGYGKLSCVHPSTAGRFDQLAERFRENTHAKK